MKLRQASNSSKWVLEAAKLAYANKAKDSITSAVLPLSTKDVISSAVPVKCVVLTLKNMSQMKKLMEI